MSPLTIVLAVLDANAHVCHLTDSSGGCKDALLMHLALLIALNYPLCKYSIASASNVDGKKRCCASIFTAAGKMNGKGKMTHHDQDKHLKT